MLQLPRGSFLILAAALLVPAARAQQTSPDFELVPLWGGMTFDVTSSVGNGGSPPFVLTGELGMQLVMQPGPFSFGSLAFNGGVIGTSVPSLHAPLQNWTIPGFPVVGTADLSNLTFTVTSPLAPVGPANSFDYAHGHAATFTVLSGQFVVTMTGQAPLVLDLTGITLPSVPLAGVIQVSGNVIRLYTQVDLVFPFNFQNGIHGVMSIGGDFFAEHELVQRFCSGDGSGTPCPCGNDSSAGGGRGCLNSTGVGALLDTTGSPSLAVDTLVLVGSDLPAGTSSLFFQGTVQAGAGSGVVFGDGLRCVSGTLVRLGTKVAAGGTASYPAGGDARVSVKGMVPAAASTRFYQVWYRNAVAFCTPQTFNLTNALSVLWIP